MRPTTNIALHSALAAALIAFAATSAAAAADIYLKFEGIKGSVAATGELCPGDDLPRDNAANTRAGKDWIQIDSYQWGTARGMTGTAGTAANREASSPSVSEIAVTKMTDTATPKLAKPLARGSLTLKMPAGQCIVGARYPAATLNTPYMRYEMENVMVSSCSASSGGGGGSLPMEEISFNYDKISTAYTKQDKKEPDKPYRPKWDTPKPEAQ